MKTFVDPEGGPRQQHAAAVSDARLGQGRLVGEGVVRQVEERRVGAAGTAEEGASVGEDVPVRVELHRPVGDALDAPGRAAGREDLDVVVDRHRAGLVPAARDQHAPVGQPRAGRVPAPAPHVDLAGPGLGERIENVEVVQARVVVAADVLEGSPDEEQAPVGQEDLASAPHVGRRIGAVPLAGDRIPDVGDAAVGVLLHQDELAGGQQDRVHRDGGQAPRRTQRPT
jgi:hypothetical protein